MASYKIEWKRSAGKEVKKLPKILIPRIIAAVEELAENPFPSGCRKITGTEHTYRIRIGDYRILYAVESDRLIIVIIRIGHRKNIYK